MWRSDGRNPHGEIYFPLTEERGAAGRLPMLVNQCTESEGECCAAGAARKLRDKRRRKEAAKERH
ncbi:hypothetical protein E2C01_014490 [Portunus trituberculatus]|uniref:Uncharacterized protein n=1 Tax=Portunus trituberculatus TaxID=210409 RepID=A0A5B7DJB7_PORTR|nr:hypothetical protein [Portunus trituberculatus]